MQIAQPAGALATLAIALLTLPAPAYAGPSDYVVTPIVEQGEREIDFKAGTTKLRDGSRESAFSLGLGYGALDMAVTYAKDRKQFGKAISEFQAIQWMLADCKTELDAASLLTYRAAWLCDQGRAYSKEASIAKLFASEAASRACNKSLQIHGGYGYTREFAVERHLRDAKICEIGEGTSEVQRMVIAKHLLVG